MSASDVSITFAAILLWEAPGGDVRLADGGVVTFDPGSGEVAFEGENASFGTIAAFDVIENAAGDSVEAGTIAFAPSSDATLSDWWREDLENTRLRIWVGETAAGSAALTDEELVADWLVDTATREQGPEGQDVLEVRFMSRLEKLFQFNQGNVCSDRFHRSIWSGERGFENCHDGPQYFAWGTEAPRGSGTSNTFGNGGRSPGGPGFPGTNFEVR